MVAGGFNVLGGDWGKFIVILVCVVFVKKCFRRNVCVIF